jgi:S-phase kinase-associated protein 1
VIEYAKQHEEDVEKENSTDEIFEWDKEFVNVDKDLLFDIILAANYLDMKNLLELGCKTGIHLFY